MKDKTKPATHLIDFSFSGLPVLRYCLNDAYVAPILPRFPKIFMF